MPFTPAHAVVALPFARSRRWSATAIASGAVAPDLPLFVSGGVGYDETHSLWAVPTLDLVLGLLCLALWWALLRPGLLAVLPGAVRARIGPRRPAPMPLLPLGVAAGALTHLVWDAFTHRGRLGSALLPVLAERVGPFPLTSWAQYASGVGGLLLLGGAAIHAYRRSNPEADRFRSPLAAAAAPTGIAVVTLAVVAAAVAVGGIDHASAVRSAWAYTAATVSIVWAAIGLAAVGLAVQVRGRLHPAA